MKKRIKDGFNINIDKKLRDKLGLNIGDKLFFNIVDDKLILSKFK